MTWLSALRALSVAATIGAGVWLELKPRRLPASRLLKGSVLATWRILRCQPFSKGGYAPVP